LSYSSNCVTKTHPLILLTLVYGSAPGAPRTAAVITCPR